MLNRYNQIVSSFQCGTVGDMVSLDIEPSLADQWQHTTKQVHTKGLMKPVSNMLLSALTTGKNITSTGLPPRLASTRLWGVPHYTSRY